MLTKRNTAYIRIPGKTGEKTKTEITREIVEFVLTKKPQNDLRKFIIKHFEQDAKSADQAINSLKNCGLIKQVHYKPTFYAATSAAKEWYNSHDDLNLIRILHYHKLIS